MANVIDTDVMRSSASVFATNSSAFTDEAVNIKSTLSNISTALEQVVKDFSTHNSDVAGFANDVSNATQAMESVWQSNAATAFQDSFTKFNTAMLNLSQMLQDISTDFNDIKLKIEELVNNNVLRNVETYASECLIDSQNLTAYANAIDENEEKLASAYGH